MLHVGDDLRAPAAQTRKLRAPARKALELQAAREQLLPVVARYTALKRERELLDFGDVVALAAERRAPARRCARSSGTTSRVAPLDETSR